MRRLITYLDALFVGMLLGLIFVTVMHAAPLHRRGALHVTSHDAGSFIHKQIGDRSPKLAGWKAD